MNRSGIGANESLAHRSSGLPLNYLQRYGLAVVSNGVALGISLLLQHFGFRVPSALLLLFAVAISSWYGGPGPAVLAALLSIISFDWYFVEPVRTLYIYRSDIPYFIVFTAFVALLSWFGTIRRRAEADLREQAALLNLTHDTVLVMDMEGVIQYWNRGARERYGWTAEQAVGRVVHDLLKTVFPAPIDQIKAEVTRTGHWEGELLHTKKDGTQVVVASRWALRRDKRDAPVAILETNNDITERKRAEEALRRLNRELRAISNCNQTLLRASDEQSLLEEICRIVCEEAGYRMAFVAYAEDDDAKSVRPVAWTGAEEGYLATVGLTWADTERGRSPTGTAIRSGKSCCVQDFATDPRLAPWREGLLQRDLRAGIALPLKDENDNAFGSLTIYSAQPNTFTPEEVRLLEELAADLAFGIVTLRSGAARQRAEQALRQSEAYLAEAQRLSHTGSWALDVASGNYVYSSEEYLRISGFDPQQGLPAKDQPLQQIHPDDLDKFWQAFQKLIDEKVDSEGEYRIVLPDGTVKYVHAIRHPVLNANGELVEIVGTTVDITERKRAEEELHESETRFRTFVDHAGDALFVQDLAEGTIVDVNREACESLGYTRQELIGKTPLGFHLDSDRAELESAAERAAAGETVVGIHRHRRKDGSVFPVEANTSCFWYGGRRFLLHVSRDITDRLRAEKAIRESEKQLRDVIDTIPALVWSTLPDGSVDFINRRTVEFTGLSFEQASGEGWQSVIHPEDRDDYLAVRDAAMTSAQAFELEARIRRADGEYRWMLFRSVPLRDETGTVVKRYGVSTDIDDRRRAQQALRRSEAYLADAQRLAHTGSWAWDPATRRTLFWSEEMFKIFGVDPQEGGPDAEVFWQRIHPDDFDRTYEVLMKAAGENVDYEHEHRIVLPDGTIKHIHAIGHPVLDESGRVIEYVGTAVDITERKRAEEALRRAEGYLVEAQRLTHTGAWATDAEPQPLYWSQELFRLYGLDPQQGFPTHEQAVQRVHPEDRDRYVQTFHRVIHQKVDSDVEFRTVLPDGTIRYLYGLGHPILNANGDVIEVVGTTVDITERKRAEEERTRLRQLEADLAHINRVSMMGELAASIAHEVNQPLSGVVSNASACLRWLAGDAPNMEEAREATRRIVRDGKRAGEVIARIRALTKKAATPRERLHLNETIREVLALVGDQAKRNSVMIRTRFADDVAPVSGDQVQLQQVVLNLVMNGIEAMSSVGERVRELVITTRNLDPDQVQVTVEDSGTGLDPNTITKIFDAFYTTKPGGMGMGLSISRSILQAHGGRLWATAKDGPGTVFHFTLPKYQEEESNARVAAV